jgi:hypothetical protein
MRTFGCGWKIWIRRILGVYDKSVISAIIPVESYFALATSLVSH